jgi:hypothetical protein
MFKALSILPLYFFHYCYSLSYLLCLKIAKPVDSQRFQERRIIMSGKDKPFIFVRELSNPTIILPYIPEVRIVQSQQGTD